MTRNVHKLAAFCNRFSITSSNCERGVQVRARKQKSPLDISAQGGLVATAPFSRVYRQPLVAISCTAALFFAPICSADTESALKLPKLFRIGLLPYPLRGYSLLASA